MAAPTVATELGVVLPLGGRVFGAKARIKLEDEQAMKERAALKKGCQTHTAHRNCNA